MTVSKEFLKFIGGPEDAEAFSGLRCKVHAKNSTPESWDVVIVGGAVEFTYKEGDKETDGASDLYIKTGQSQQFAESDPSKCVRKMIGALKYIRTRTDDEGIIEGESDEVPDGECAAEWTLEIAPALTWREDAKGNVPPLRLIVSKFA